MGRKWKYMMKKKFEDVVSEILVIKDLYICGRMNLAIADTITNHEGYSEHNVQEYVRLATSYVDDSAKELYQRYEDKELDVLEDDVLYIITDSCSNDFDEDLFNDMMEDYFGGIDSLGFISAYHQYGEDFNNLLREFIHKPI